jgi:hypothetical protein
LVEEALGNGRRVGHVQLRLVLDQGQLPADAADEGVVGNLKTNAKTFSGLKENGT